MLDIGDIQLKQDFIAFQFHEHVNARGMFDESGQGIIYIPNNSSHQLSAASHRWATVIKTGPEVINPDIKPGAVILIENLRWSLGIPLEGTDQKFNVTKESEVIAIQGD